MSNIKITKTTCPKQKPQDESKLGFGHIFTDHMFMMDWDKEHGWHDAQILPYGPIALDPSCSVLHYSQTIFEGLKAYRTADGDIQLFRPQENFKRLNNSNERMCIPKVDEDFMLEALKTLIEIDKDWVPHSEGASLYIRPFIFATEPFLGVHPSSSDKLLIILSPSGAYYATGLNPVAIYVEKNYVRAVRGGTGEVKTGANYAISLKAQDVAGAEGYSQVLWLDGVEQKYIEEVGAMNVFFVLGDEIVTPKLHGSILPGITRKSCVQVLKDWGYKVSERMLSIDELVEAYKAGNLKEAFGTGTAAVISPVGELKYGDLKMTINNNQIGEISQRLYDELTGIQWGRKEDTRDWIVKVCKG